MTTIVRRVHLTKNFDFYVAASWWNPWDKIEVRRSIEANREGLYDPSLSFLSITVALICIKLQCVINRGNDNYYKEEIND